MTSRPGVMKKPVVSAEGSESVCVGTNIVKRAVKLQGFLVNLNFKMSLGSNIECCGEAETESERSKPGKPVYKKPFHRQSHKRIRSF